MEPRWDLLTEPVFSVELGATNARLSLSQVLSELGRGSRVEFPALAAHHQHPWHAFLTQLAAMALARADERTLDVGADAWAGRLLALTRGQREPWCLLVQDLDKPAFMQPPVPELSVDALKQEATTPDEIDLLVTARNHDVKEGRVADAEPEDWAYTILTLQTFDGFAGRQNYGVIRMNGGYGSRPYVGAARDLSWATRFTRDTMLWLQQRQELLDEGRGYVDWAGSDVQGHGLLWTVPWDGTTTMAVTQLDPCFIEVCRRVRMVVRGEALHARKCGTKVRRVAGADLKGNTGDIWTPIRVADSAALSVGGTGFTYGTIHRVLFSGDYAWNPAVEVTAEDGSTPVVTFEVLVRGQGGTDGWHQRIIKLPPRVARMFSAQDAASPVAELSGRRVEQSGEFIRRVLRPALCALLQGAPEKLDFRDEGVRLWLAAADRRIDERFFADLWRDVDEPGEEQDRRWSRALRGIGEDTMAQAIEGAPVPHARRYRAIAVAEAIFYGSMRRRFPAAMSFNEEDQK